MKARMWVWVLLLAGCAKRPAPEATAVVPAAASARSPFARVRTAGGRPVAEAPARAVAAGPGSAVVSPPFPARVLALHVAPGQRVAAGAPIADVSMPAVVEAAGLLVAVEGRLALFEKRRAELTRLRNEGLIDGARLFEVEASLADLAGQRTKALATLSAAGVPARRAQALVESGRWTLASPIAGVVTSVDAAVGEVREAGGAPLARLAGRAPVHVEARLARPLPQGAVVQFLGADGTELPLHPEPISSVVAPDDGVTLVWFAPQAPAMLAHGLRGRLRVSVGGADALEVPARSLREERGAAFLLRRSGDRTEKVPVRVLAAGDAAAVVTGPLKEGDEVASDLALVLGAVEEGGR